MSEPPARTAYLRAGLRKDAIHLKKRGEHKVGGACLYINQLRHVDRKVRNT